MLQYYVPNLVLQLGDLTSYALQGVYSLGIFRNMVRPLFTIDDNPDFIGWYDANFLGITSVPMFSYWTNSTIDETRYWSLAINLEDPSDSATINEIVDTF